MIIIIIVVITFIVIAAIEFIYNIDIIIYNNIELIKIILLVIKVFLDL